MGFILNTSYKVQVDLLESESNINIENGTLHVIDNKLKVHLNDEIKNITISNYKVYTALLTQSGGSSILTTSSGFLTIGVTYKINNPNVNSDFTNVGAPNNLLNTYFVATGTTPNNWGINTNILEYNTGAPVVTVLENTIGNIWFTYNSVGGYLAKSNGLFAIDKCYQSLSLNTDLSAPNGCLFSIQKLDTSDLFIQTNNPTAEMGFDGQLNNTPIEIRVYN